MSTPILWQTDTGQWFRRTPGGAVLGPFPTYAAARKLPAPPPVPRLERTRAGEAIRAWRRANGLSQTEAGALLGLAVNRYGGARGAVCRELQRYESGDKYPPARVLEMVGFTG